MAKSALQKRHIKSLEWAILLCRADLGRCSEGDRLNLKEALYDFIYWADQDFKMSRNMSSGLLERYYKNRRQEGYFFPPVPLKTFVEMVTPETLAALQESFRKKFELIVSGLPSQLWSAKGLDFAVVVSKHSGSFVRYFWPVASGWSDSLLSVTEYALIEHLTESGVYASQILSCPECKSLFLSRTKVRTDRKRYCPYNRCAAKAATRSYKTRKAEKLREKERSRSRDRYEKKIRKRYPTAPIKRKAPNKNK